MSVVLPFSREFEFTHGVAELVAPGLRRLVANNPGPFTYKGTNSYLVGTGSVALIDPGPDDEAHRAAIFAELDKRGERVSHIFLTHTHRDHSAGLPKLAELTGAPVLGFGSTAASRKAAKLHPTSDDILDVEFIPDQPLKGGERIAGGDWELEAVFTPGHAPDHLSFGLNGSETLLSGDHVMGWNTTVVAPPEGNMGDYIASLELLLQRPETVYFPGHGGRVDQAQRLVKAFIMHRRWREQQILDCIRDGLDTIDLIVPRIYETLAESLRDAAAYSVLGHLELLAATGRVIADPHPGRNSRYSISDARG
ncbi:MULTISPECIES: MBL fold metallo-hydrolase [Rhodomicrobium]|uniref:MBL fold metallo-hydrolase n=1 Tax=Rhodomicrobium TaxID=1068 RepID=UPI000B4A64A7|nr:MULTISPECIES: MBL fold metallo-hydrolase [Rhodomicrobium]